MGFALTTGGKLRVGKKGNDFRIMATYGSGLGRFLAAGFVAGAATDIEGHLKPIQTINGYVAYNLFWKPNTLSSSFTIAAFQAMHNKSLVAQETNNMSYSMSGNLKYDPIPQLRLGVEYMYGERELLNGKNGAFHRIQLAAKYVFGYHNSMADEKR